MESRKTIADLPVYDSANQTPRELWVLVDNPNKSDLESVISSVRQGVCSAVRQLNSTTQQMSDYFQSSKDSADKKLTYLRSESTVVPKVAFISLSTMSGLLIGFKKSTFKKALYCGLLGVGSAALVFPNEFKGIKNQTCQIVNGEAKQFYRTYIWPEEKSKFPKGQKVTQVDTSNAKDTVITLNKEELNSAAKSSVVGNKGMSNDDDSDMYTTREK
jgi:hypothetical protein